MGLYQVKLFENYLNPNICPYYYYLILGECWVKFLQNISTSFINDAQFMLSVWLKHELEKNVISRIPSDRRYLD